MHPNVRIDDANFAGVGSILRQDVDFTKLLLNLLDSLDAIRGSFSDTLGQAVQFSSLGTTAIGIDGGQSSNDDSFSRKIQIGSVLEILVFANGKRRLIGRIASKYAPWASGG
jgi:hypothetical protein